jgi:serine protease AprX
MRKGADTFLLLALLMLLAEAASAQPARVAPLANRRAAQATGSSRLIVMARDAASLSAAADAVRRAGAVIRRTLPIINAHVVDLPNAAINGLAASPFIAQIALDRAVAATMERTGPTVGATQVRQNFGYDGVGIGVAVIDSGVTSWHDDLTDRGGGQRVVRFVDFVNGLSNAYDDFGHGTHVAGIIAGNGFDSDGARAGIAPRAQVIALKVLDSTGAGHISDVIAALDYVVTNRLALNIRVVNLSVATGVYDSYNSDPLTLAAKRAVEAGIVVVAAAGNYGRNADGRVAYGGVTAPGNAPWVLTVGASSHMGTVDRADDTMAMFSSHGPTAIDSAAKPDLVAPGVGIESLSDPASAWYSTQSPYLIDGTEPTTYRPYLSQSGTSMSAPVVAGTVALMLQANPTLSPNAVKAILQYTAQFYASNDPLTEGAGFLNASGAVALARYFAAPSGDYPSADQWSKRLIWGNRMIAGGRITADANAWSTTVVWGRPTTPAGQAVAWGQICSSGNCNGNGNWISWANTCPDDTCGTGTWSTGWSRNVVWGTRCGDANCQDAWSAGLFSSSDGGDTVVWGTSVDGGDTVVWGTGSVDTVVWGTTTDGDTVVWGTNCMDPSCTPIVWGR